MKDGLFQELESQDLMVIDGGFPWVPVIAGVFVGGVVVSWGAGFVSGWMSK